MEEKLILKAVKAVPLSIMFVTPFLIGILIGSMFGDIAWVIKLIRNLFFPHIDYSIVTFFN